MGFRCCFFHLALGSSSISLCAPGRSILGACGMNDSLMWAAHYRQRAAECIELADGSFDPGIEAHYRSLAGRYIKLAGAEEDFATGKEARTACLPDCITPMTLAGGCQETPLDEV